MKTVCYFAGFCSGLALFLVPALIVMAMAGVL